MAAGPTLATLKVDLSMDKGAVVQRQLADLATTADRTERSFGGVSAASRVMNGVIAQLAAALAVQKLVQYADGWKNIESRIGLVTRSHTDMLRVQREVFAVAQATRAEFSATADVYTKMARNASTLHASQQDLLAVTGTLNKAFVVSGASTAQQSAALLQLGQAFASGVLRGDEFNSVMENAPRVAEALAKSLNVPQGKLRELAEAGKLSSRTLFDALKKASDDIDKEFRSMPVTIAQSFVVARNEVQKFIGEEDSASGASRTLADSIVLLAHNLDTLAAAGLAVGVVMAGRYVAGFAAASAAQMNQLSVAAEGDVVLRQRAAMTLAAANAETTRTAAVLASLRADQAAVAVAREEAVARLAAANARMAGAVNPATLAPLGGAVVAREMAAQNAAIAAQSVALRDLGILGAQQTNINRALAASEGQLAASTEAATLAQNAQAATIARTTIAARAGTVAMGALSTVTAALGGPIGVAILAAYGIYTAISKWTDAAVKNAEQTEAESVATDKAIASMHARVAAQKQVADQQKQTSDAVTRSIAEQGVAIAKQAALNAAHGQSEFALRLIEIRYDALAQKLKNVEGHTVAQTAALNVLTDAMTKQQIEAEKLAKADRDKATYGALDDRVRAAAQELALVGQTGLAAEKQKIANAAINESMVARRNLTGKILADTLNAIVAEGLIKTAAAEANAEFEKRATNAKANAEMWQRVWAEAIRFVQDRNENAAELERHVVADRVRRESEAAAGMADAYKTAFKDIQRSAASLAEQMLEGATVTLGDIGRLLQSTVAKMIAAVAMAKLVRASTTSGGGVGVEGLGASIARDAAKSGAAGGVIGYGIGYGSGSTGVGVLGGGAGGALAGAMIAGPFGAVIGGLAGAAGGLLGAAKAQQEAAKALQGAARSALENAKTYIAGASGNSLEAQLVAARQQFEAVIDQLNAAAMDNYKAVGGFAAYTKKYAEIEAAGAAIRQKIADDFWGGITQQMNALSGPAGEYRNQMDALLASYKQNILAADALHATEEQRQQIIDIYTRSVERLNEALAEGTRRFQEDLDVRRIAATGTDREADDARFAYNQRRELYDLAKTGAPTGGLEMIQNFERLRRTFELDRQDQIVAIQKAADAQIVVLNAQLKTAQDEFRVAEDQQRTLEQTLNETRRVADSLREYGKSLVLNPSLTTLSPTAQYREAGKQLEDIFRRAQLGDKAAGSGFTSLADTFLGLSKGNNASGTAYAADFARVQEMTRILTGQFDLTASIQEQQLAEAVKHTDLLRATIDRLGSAIEAIRAAAEAQIAALNAKKFELIVRPYDPIADAPHPVEHPYPPGNDPFAPTGTGSGTNAVVAALEDGFATLSARVDRLTTATELAADRARAS